MVGSAKVRAPGKRVLLEEICHELIITWHKLLSNLKIDVSKFVGGEISKKQANRRDRLDARHMTFGEV